MHALVRGERREVGAPRLALPGRDVGLGAVVDHERELRERGGDARGRRQVLGEQQQVVGQARLRDGAQPARDVVALEPARVGLVVDVVADAHQALPARRRSRRAASRSPASGAVRSIQPTTPATSPSDSAASASSSSVSSSLDAAWTATVAPTPSGSTVARSSSRPIGRRSAAASPVIHG